MAILAEMAYLAKVAEMAINRQNCQIVGLITGRPNAVLANRKNYMFLRVQEFFFI